MVQDESHLFGKGNSAKLDCANAIRSSLRWGVTATPCTSSATDLTKQMRFLQGGSSYGSFTGDFTSLQEAIQRFHSRPSQTTLSRLVDLLQRNFMILHTKSQRINGSAALALPPSTTSTGEQRLLYFASVFLLSYTSCLLTHYRNTVMLTMSRDEDAAFNFSE